MHAYILYSLVSLGALLLFTIVNSFITSRRHTANARKWNCGISPELKSPLPLGISNVIQALKADKEKRLPPFLIERSAEVNNAPTFRYNILGTENYFTTDPKNIQAILATQFEDFSLGETRRSIFYPLLGNGIFTTDGKAWEHSRALLRPQFARNQVSDLDLEETHVQNMMRALPVDPATGWTAPTDLQVLFFRLTIDSATEFLFGESVDSQIAELPENRLLNVAKDPTRDEKVFAHAFDTGQSYLAMRARLQDRYWLIYNAEFRRSCKLVHAFVDYYVNLALSPTAALSSAEKGLARSPTSKSEKYTFLAALAASTQDPIELRTQLLNILLAGRDTTAGLLGWLFHHLMRHPDIYAKLRAAVLDDFGSYEHPRDISFARLKSCTYLQHCLSETLRVNPVVPINSRKATRDTTIPRGGGPHGDLPLYVKKGQQVDYSVHVMHQRKDLWGDDAEEWRPERWAGRKTGWEYLPFNGGPRICIGQQFALTEAGYVAVRLLQRFEGVESLEGVEGARHNVTLTSHNGNGVRVRLRAA